MVDSCRDLTVAVNMCHSKYGKASDNCMRDELLYKKCYAQHLCPPEAKKFYHEKIKTGNYKETQVASCSTLLERFAFEENEMMLSQEMINSKDVKSNCRAIARDLAKCMSNRYNPSTRKL